MMCSIRSPLVPFSLIVAVAELVFTAVVVLGTRFLMGLPALVGRLIGANEVRVFVVVVVVVLRVAAVAPGDDVVVVEDAVVARFAIGAAAVGLEIGVRADGLCKGKLDLIIG